MEGLQVTRVCDIFPTTFLLHTIIISGWVGTLQTSMD